MLALCHRCGADLSIAPDVRFCPQCGAPQLRLSSALTGEMDDSASTTGAAHPPRPSLIVWRRALRCALTVTAVMLLLFAGATRVPALSLLWMLWTGASSLIALELYQHRHQGTRMDAAIGARIGASVGVVMAAALSTALATAGVVERYYLHGLVGFDRDLHERMTEQIRAAVASNPAAAGLARESLLSGLIAGSLLLGLAMSVFFLLLVSILGGALGGLIRERRHAAS